MICEKEIKNVQQFKISNIEDFGIFYEISIGYDSWFL